MNQFERIRQGIDVAPLREQLTAQPELWNVHPNRTGFDGSPFAGTADIWLRYRRLAELTTSEAYREPHFAEFYPAWYLLPAVRPIVFSLMAQLEAVYLGGILITKIPAGGQILPHNDQGSWHAHWLNTKVYVGIQTNPDCVNYCGGEETVIRDGEAVIFDNLVEHSVVNNGATDRMTLIACFRCEPLVS